MSIVRWLDRLEDKHPVLAWGTALGAVMTVLPAIVLICLLSER